MTTGCPRARDIGSATMRATMSLGPPAAKGTIIVMGRSGHAARAGAATARASTAAASAHEARARGVTRGAGLIRGRPLGASERVEARGRLVTMGKAAIDDAGGPPRASHHAWVRQDALRSSSA